MQSNNLITVRYSNDGVLSGYRVMTELKSQEFQSIIGVGILFVIKILNLFWSIEKQELIAAAN